nr:hypothetical protein [uncultured Rhodoferax sp.]
MNSRKPLYGRVLAIPLVLGLSACADLNNLMVQLGSSRPAAILQVQGQRLDGTVTLSPDRTGTLNVTASQGEPSICMGQLRFTSNTQGEVDLRCNDGTAAALQFSMLTAVKGYAYGAGNKGPVALTFGMWDDEAPAYLPAQAGSADTAR